MSPYLFVIAMEYLQRELSVITDHPLFKFHPKFEKLRFMHICFGYDLLMFCKANVASVKLLFDAFSKFFKVIGLQANTEKNFIYISGVQEQVKLEILRGVL